ncbi:MAG: hypothetical protein IKG18_11550 [Atopobiaceae bacterium]|nr:hypothetical protein [Atopobiaceae bacterium]
MFSAEQRRIAIETFIKYDHSYADTVAELGYPNRATLRLWWKEYESTGEIPEGKGTRQSKYTDEQMRAAVDHYLEHGRSLSRTMRAMGYPKGRQTLCDWVDELAPGSRKRRGPRTRLEPVPIEKKVRGRQPTMRLTSSSLSRYPRFSTSSDATRLRSSTTSSSLARPSATACSQSFL